ncbi:MAG: helix-turn-helix domain-containing protein [Okeania sp. SIO3B3]|nr:helix-turn-helix domain-containing protein [Okeania sp. SIO3B3]
MMAIRALLIGIPREQVAQLHDVTDRTLLNWIYAFNEQGIDGLIAQKSPGAPSIIGEEQRQVYKELIENPSKANCTCQDGDPHGIRGVGQVVHIAQIGEEFSLILQFSVDGFHYGEILAVASGEGEWCVGFSPGGGENFPREAVRGGG